MGTDSPLTFAEERNLAVSIKLANGIEVTEPDTMWAINGFPAVNGIAHLYGLGNSWGPIARKLGEPADRNYFATKYGDELGERLHEESMGEWTEDIGSVDELGWYGRVDLGVGDLLELGWIFFADSFLPKYEHKLPIGAILSSDDQGFCYYGLYFEGEEQMYVDDWKNIEDGYAEYWHRQEQEEASA